MSTDRHNFSDETLNAFIDNELDPTEYQHVLEAAQADNALSARICELRRMRELVNFAYREPPRPAPGLDGRARPAMRRTGVHHALAASVIAGLCLTGGWFAHGAYEQHLLAATAMPPEAFTAARVDRVNDNAGRNIIVHLNSGDPNRHAVALDMLEDFANSRTNRDDRVVLLTNDGGIDLLRADISPYAKRVQALIDAHPNVKLIACKVAIDSIERQMGEKVELLPGTTLGRTAVEEIVTRLEEGWTYMKI